MKTLPSIQVVRSDCHRGALFTQKLWSRWAPIAVTLTYPAESLISEDEGGILPAAII